MVQHMKKADLIFYLAYIVLFILFGIWLLVWAIGLLPGFAEMFLFWLLSTGILLIILGCIKTKRKTRGMNLKVTSGLILSIITLVLLALMYDMLNVWIGVAVAVILIGFVSLGIFLSGVRGTIED